MKNDRQYRDSLRFVFMGFIGIAVTCVLVLIITTIPGCKEFNNRVEEGIKNDPRPATPLINYAYPGSYMDVDTLVQKDTIWE